jgi:hypothetical protein
VASNLESNLVAHKFKQKVLNFCENSHLVNHSNFWYVTFYPPHENLVLEILAHTRCGEGLHFGTPAVSSLSSASKVKCYYASSIGSMHKHSPK